MPPTPSTVSFTVRRPTPVSRPSSSGPESDGPFKIPALPRHLASAGSSTTGSPLAGSPRTFSSREDSDDDEETGIVFASRSGADNDSHHTDSSDEEDFIASSKQPSDQRLHKKKKASDPEKTMVIPSQPNPDWREAARRRRAACSRVQSHTSRATPTFAPDSALSTTGETEDQEALRAILAGEDDPVPLVEIIPVPSLSEADALKQDVQELPDVATADDYERVPISTFGAALLRGMGWTDGAVAPKTDKRRKNGLTGLYLPQARPALLGIGAKEQEPEDDGSGKKKPRGKDMRYIPVARKESERGENGSGRSGTVSRRSSRSPSRNERADRVRDRERSDRERRKERDRDDSKREAKDRADRVRERRDYKDKDRMEKDRSHRSGLYLDQRRERDRRDLPGAVG